MSDKWIQRAIHNTGALRKSLKINRGEKIPEKKLVEATKSKDPTTRKRADLAKTLRKMK